MIEQVIIDMIPFLTIFIIAVVAFADSFQSIKEILIIQGSAEREINESTKFYEVYIQAYLKAW